MCFKRYTISKWESLNHSIMRKMVMSIMIILSDKGREVLTHLGTPDGAVDGDLLVPPDTERSDRVAGFGEHWGLPSQLLKHL